MWEQQRCVSEDHPCLASQNPMKSKQEKSCRGVSVWTENEKQSSNQFTWVERRCLTFGEWQWRRGIPSDTHSLLVTRCCGWVHPCRTHRFSSIIVILDDVHKKTRSGWETVCMSQPGRKLTRRLIDMSCVWLTYNGSIREVLIPFGSLFGWRSITPWSTCCWFYFVILHTSSSFCHCTGREEGNCYLSFTASGECWRQRLKLAVKSGFHQLWPSIHNSFCHLCW